MAHPALAWLLGPSFGEGDEGRRRHPGDAIRAREQRECERVDFGDEQTLAALYVKYFGELWTFASRYVRNQAAADIVHDVFLTLWETRASIEVWTTIRAYLFSAVANRARNAAARERRDDSLAAVLPSLMTLPMPSENDGTDSELAQAVTNALASLPERQQLAFTLRLTNEMTYAEIATVLGVTKGAVSQLIHKAQSQLRRSLGAYLE
jgi:RNA polymerase sigma-70 factor (ECF subfamily)